MTRKTKRILCRALIAGWHVGSPCERVYFPAGPLARSRDAPNPIDRLTVKSRPERFQTARSNLISPLTKKKLITSDLMTGQVLPAGFLLRARSATIAHPVGHTALPVKGLPLCTRPAVVNETLPLDWDGFIAQRGTTKLPSGKTR